jgi:DNA end-binding protein Ku
MAKTKKKKTAQRADDEPKHSRSLWKGSISFGLVNIPVALHSVTAEQKLSFRLLDRRDFAPVHYQRVNQKSGKEVPWDDIVKGYEYEKDEFVVLGDADFERANVQATQTIAISEFVDGAEISPIYFDKPYYLTPLKHGEKGYALLREVLRRTGKVGIARMVLRSREYLAALIVHGDVLVVDLLRFAHELRDADKLAVPGKDIKQLKISEREIAMAKQLVETLEEPWHPEQFHEQYYDDLMKIIDAKIKSGKTKTIEERSRTTAPRTSKIVDITHLLKQSVERAQQNKQPAARRKAS